MNGIENEIKLAAQFGAQAEELVVTKGQYSNGERTTLLLAYWSLAFEFHKAILYLLQAKYCGAAFALVRPLIETTIRAHLVLFVSDDVLKKITADEYRTNFGTVGKEIDVAFGMGDLFENFLTGARDALHGYTHVGMHQLGRRFTGTDLTPNYAEREIVEAIRTSNSAVFMVNNIVTKHLGFEEDWKENNRLFDEWSRRGSEPQT